jgi:hypothetical protein
VSYVFAVGDDEVWGPALRIGKLFMDIANLLASNVEFVDTPIGLTAMASDYYYVEPEVFAGFVRAILASSIARNPTYRELARGFIVISLVILDRAGVVVEPLDESQRDLFEAKAEMAKGM